MSGSGRLSLRARLLVLLIAVTAAFLLIMGAVTAVVLNKRLSGQFNADLVATAARSPQALAGNTNGYLAAAVSAAPARSSCSPRAPAARSSSRRVSQLSRAQLVQDTGRQPFTHRPGRRHQAARGRTACSRAAALDVGQHPSGPGRRWSSRTRSAWSPTRSAASSSPS